mgnify:CR=1 FL=1
MEKYNEQLSDQPKDTTTSEMQVILFNDDHNTFDFVIDSLMEICDHEEEQAEQCALIAHLKGKCTVKTGNYEELSAINMLLRKKGLHTILS